MTPPAHPGRSAVAGATLALTVLLIALDLAASQPIDPFATPPPAALGSGLTPGGAHCASPG